MVCYTKDHLVYWPGFFQSEIELDETEALKVIVSLLANRQQFGLITIYVNFISIFSKTLDFFQQGKPVFPFIESQLQNLSTYIESNMVATNFFILDSIITNYHFQPYIGQIWQKNCHIYLR